MKANIKNKTNVLKRQKH